MGVVADGCHVCVFMFVCVVGVVGVVCPVSEMRVSRALVSRVPTGLCVDRGDVVMGVFMFEMGVWVVCWLWLP